MDRNKVLKIKSILLQRFDKFKTLICCLFSVVAFTLVFVSGIFSNDTRDEVCANYFREVCLNHTTIDGDKKLAGLIVQPKSGHNAKMNGDTQTEIDSIWGAFKGENASFAPVINANKEVDIHFIGEGVQFSTNNLSILYSSLGDSAQPYHTKKVFDEKTNKETEVPIDYKFQCSPLAMMFPSARSGPQSQMYIYISQAQAESKLKSQGIQDINLDALESLLGSTVDIDFGGEIRNCVIDNIFLDNFVHDYEFPQSKNKYNYYYGTDVGTILGDYIFLSTYALRPNVFPQNLIRQGMYFMSEYTFMNKFYLQYAKSAYTPNDYEYCFATANIEKGVLLDNNILQAALNEKKNSAVSSLITALAIMCFLCAAVYLFINKLYFSPLSLLLVGISSVFPYIVFKIIFSIVKNSLIFSSYSTIFNFILLIIYAIFIFFLEIYSRKIAEGKAKQC